MNGDVYIAQVSTAVERLCYKLTPDDTTKDLSDLLWGKPTRKMTRFEHASFMSPTVMAYADVICRVTFFEGHILAKKMFKSSSNGYFILSRDRKIIMDPTKASVDESIIFGLSWIWFNDECAPSASIREYSIGFVLHQAIMYDIDDHVYSTKCMWIDQIQQEALRVTFESYENLYDPPAHVATNYIIPTRTGNVFIMPDISEMMCYPISIDDTAKDISDMLWGTSTKRMVRYEACPFMTQTTTFTDVACNFFDDACHGKKE